MALPRLSLPVEHFLQALTGRICKVGEDSLTSRIGQAPMGALDRLDRGECIAAPEQPHVGGDFFAFEARIAGLGRHRGRAKEDHENSDETPRSDTPPIRFPHLHERLLPGSRLAKRNPASC
jgi:hypothetical protein